VCVCIYIERDRGVVGSARFCHLTARYVCVCVYIHREREGLWGALDSVTLLRSVIARSSDTWYAQVLTR
jgi:hypothetical protein